MKQKFTPRKTNLLLAFLVFLFVLGCKRTAKDQIIEPSKPLQTDVATSQERIPASEDSADLINYVVSLSNLLNRDNFKNYFISVKDQLYRYTPDSNEVDPILSNGLKSIIENDQPYISELNTQFSVFQSLDERYGISHYSHEDWMTVMQSAHKAGVYLFPDVKKKFLIYTENAEAYYRAAPCADAYDAYEVMIGTLLISMTTSCMTMGISWASLGCWAVTAGAYAYLEYDLQNNFWCRCMFEHYGGTCVY